MTAVDTSNAQGVGRDGHDTVIVALPRHAMTRAEALAHAAWLAVTADPEGSTFTAVLEAVRQS